MSEQKTNAMRILEKNNIEYMAHSYPHGKDAVDGETVARLMNQDPKRVFKTLVTKGSGGDYYVFVLPVQNELDLKKAARSVGEKSVEMIHVKDILKVTGYIRGGCSPVGMKKTYKTTFHTTAANLDTIIVSAGKIGSQIEASPASIIKITNGQLADIVKVN